MWVFFLFYSISGSIEVNERTKRMNKNAKFNYKDKNNDEYHTMEKNFFSEEKKKKQHKIELDMEKIANTVYETTKYDEFYIQR